MGSGKSGLYSGTHGSGPVNGSDYNSANSNTVKTVNTVKKTNLHSVPITGTSNSVTRNYKNGVLDSERYYGNDGKAYLDIDYSDHGNPKTHPTVPHEHDIWFDSDGKMHRGKDERIR